MPIMSVGYRVFGPVTVIGQRIKRLRTVADRMLEEITVDNGLLAEFSDDVLPA
jgi:hypothetical protein